MSITFTRPVGDAGADTAATNGYGGQEAGRRVGCHSPELSAQVELGGQRAEPVTPEAPARRVRVAPVPRPVRVVSRATQEDAPLRSSGRLGCDSPAAPSVHGSRLTRRGRLAVTVAWLVLAVVAVWPVLGGDGGTGSSGETTSVRVDVGDTLWELALEANPQADPRGVVSAIVEINGLRDAGDIRPGDRLQIPVAVD
ncbi:LysM peptidoglycan-binding domain-containing protein [Phytoactinopolyspora alkaliphila]|uniref:LysM peptidoglycan-binding domain-containing protein n=1 Tax=Phytoactinopolyspora alkaliphila TaxID=1783498 RepID=A0A6N9YFY8_9ACTN|nr:LysM peptidoglycan-binding domain-containing protein [Phytoactinopolyspora alkaliphila]NED93799.1 LysM peptidoglycan-binding domain-containing protein [Phytoactinopolyspora alkaliphila]